MIKVQSEKEDLEESVLYEPVKSLAPMIFPNLIKSESEQDGLEENQA